MKEFQPKKNGSITFSTDDSENSSSLEGKNLEIISNIESAIDMNSLPLTAHNRSTHMEFLRKVYIGVMIQTIFSTFVIYSLNNHSIINAWISLPNMKIFSVSVSITLIAAISITTYIAPEFIRDSCFISSMFLFIFATFWGFLIQCIGNSLYIYSVYGGFLIILSILFIYTYFAENEFNFFWNFIICVTTATVYLFIVIGYILNRYYSIIPAFGGATFFSFYSIFFSQFVIGRSSMLYKKDDYIFGALKFNLDFTEVLVKVIFITFSKLFNVCSKKTDKEEFTFPENTYNTINK
jgi:hypothetical protein